MRYRAANVNESINKRSSAPEITLRTFVHPIPASIFIKKKKRENEEGIIPLKGA